jgi:hypothetical protein
MDDRLRACFDGAGARVAQHADGLDDPVAALRDRGRLARQHAASGGLGVTGIVLAEVTTTHPRRARDLDHLDVLEHQRSGQPGAVAPSTFNASTANGTELLRPLDQRAHPAAGRRERLGGDEPAE